MGFFKAPTPQTPVVKQGPSAKEIRSQEEAKIRQEQRQALTSAESRRTKLRRQLTGEENEEEIQRKRLFGE